MLNVLLITADQWRGEATGYAGHPLVRTPNIDLLAGEGVAFLNHYAPAAPCSPARACLYTGLYQMNNRVCRNGSPLASRFDNIALAARRAGYDPQLFGYTDIAPDPAVLHPNDPALTTYEGVLPGFTARRLLPEHEKPYLSWLRLQGIESESWIHLPRAAPPEPVSPAPPIYGKDQTQTAFLTDEFVRWLGEQDKPWFAHLSFLRPHPPFIVPQPYNTMYAPADVGEFRRAATPDAEAAIHPLLRFALSATPKGSFVPGAQGLVRDFTDADFRQIKAIYFGMISEVDAQLGCVFQALRDHGDWDDTLIVFTSDHAEMMGDHWYLGKGGFFDESQHIPLVIRDPRQPRQYGRRVQAFTEAVDIYPTVLEAIGAAPAHQPDGRALTPFVEGHGPGAWRDAVHWEFDFREVARQTTEGWFGLRSNQLNLAVIRTEKWKYVHFAALPPLLFDMQADPACQHDLANDPAHLEVRLAMAEKLLAWRAEHLDQTLALKELTPNGVVTASI